jgi:hypothetical protein
LARAAGVDRDLAAGEPAARDAHGRTAAVPEDLHRDPERDEGAGEVFDRALAHARVAVDHDRAVGEGRGHRQEARRGSGIAHHERAVRRPQDAPGASHLPGLRVLPNRATEAVEGLEHDTGVVARERPSQLAVPLREGRDQQRAIRDALRARNADAGVEGAAWGDGELCGRLGHRSNLRGEVEN